MKLCLQDKNVEIHLTHSDGKFVVAERFIKEQNL